jgi:hypothetical protein
VQNEKEEAAQDKREQKESEFSISRESLESLVIQLRENNQKFDQFNSEWDMKQDFVISKNKNEKRRDKIELIVLINEILQIISLARIENKS